MPILSEPNPRDPESSALSRPGLSLDSAESIFAEARRRVHIRLLPLLEELESLLGKVRLI